MRIAVTGASGFIGSAVVAALAERGDEVIALGRAPERIRLPTGAQAQRFDPLATPDPAPFEGADAVIHLAGESVAGRWTAEKKRAIFDSRVAGTRNLVASLSACERRPRVLVAASAVGYYGDRRDEPLLESAPPGNDFLAEVCVAWERQALAAQDLGMRVAMLRQGIVLGAGGALEAMLPLFRRFVGGPLGNGSQWMPWIHLHDDVALFLFALDRGLRGTFNAVSPDVANNARFSAALGHALGRPALAFAPAPALRIVLGEFASSLLASQLVLPDRALEAGFTFAHEILEQALLDLLAPGSGRTPATHRLEASALIRAPLDKVFGFLADVGNLERITPPEFDFRVLTPLPIDMRRGTIVEHSLKVRGLRIRWKSLISQWQPSVRFVDHQVRGPYALWRHEHRFQAHGDGVLVQDLVDYALPLAPLSNVALPFARAQLEHAFAFREKALPALVGPAS